MALASKRFLISGSDIAYDLNLNFWSSGDKTFLNSYLKATFTADSSGVYSVATTTTTKAFTGLAGFTFSTGTSPVYYVGYPDVIAPTGGSITELIYTGGPIACISYNGSYQLIYCGFPFETITTSAEQNSFMADALAFFGISPLYAPCAPDSSQPPMSWPQTWAGISATISCPSGYLPASTTRLCSSVGVWQPVANLCTGTSS